MDGPILRIQTFGGLRAWIDDEPLTLPPSRQSRALLAYLACASKPAHRASLCELLWENTPEPRAALRWCLSRLRPVLDARGETRLVAEGDSVWIASAGCEVDGKRLRELAAAAADSETEILEEAVTRFTGQFLPDLEMSDAFRFESWKVSEEKALEQARAAIFGELLSRKKSDPEASVRLGHLWAQQDPFNPHPHIAIIEALTALGRKREALAHYERCDLMLRRDGGASHAGLEKARAAIGRLGSGPGEKPLAALGNMSVTQAPSRNDSGTAASAAAIPLAGRRLEIDRFLREVDAEATERPAALKVLQGEPGIGKTRLLEEMGRILEDKGWLCLRGRAFEAERSRAFGPWIDAAMRSADFAACPLLHPMNLADQGSNDASVLFEAVRAWFATLPASAPVAIILDDLHWMDSSSIALLQYLLRNPKPPFRLMLAGVRSAAAPRNDSLDALLTVARREGWMETWDVGPLSAEDTAQLLGLLGSARDPGEVYAKSAGHPLAALALALEDGHKDGKAAGGARVSLDAMLDERIRMAGEAGRSVLQWAALLGRGLSPALLETLTDLGVHPMLGALESLEHSGLVKIASGKAGLEYLFGHDLIRERVQSSLSAARRERMHAHVAQTLRRNFSLSRGWEEIAHHAELGAIWDLAAEACLEAGLHCFRLRAYPAALEFSMRGIDHLDRLEGRWALLGQLCALANHSGGISGNFPDGFEARLSGLMLKARAAGEEETALHLLSLITNLRFEQDRFSDLRDTALQVADAPAANVDPIIRARYFADTAICLFVTDQEIAKARSMIREAQSLCERHGFREGTTEIGQAVIASREGRYAEARKQMAEAATLLSPTDYQAVEHHMLSNSAIVELESDNPLEALSFAEKLRVPSQAMAGKADAHFPDALAALAKKMLGEPEAEALFQEVLARLRACNCKVMTAYVLLFWSEMELRDGRFDRIHAFAEEALDRCTPLGRKLEPVWAHCLMGLAALRQNDRETAQSHWDRMAAIRPPRADLTARVFQRVEELALGLGHPI